MDEIIVRLHYVDWIIIGVYIAAMLLIGFWFSKKTKSFDDYFMAGRGLTAPLLVGTLVSTFYGLDTLFGTSEVGFMEGISAFFAYSLPYTVLYVVMAILSPKFKKAFPEGTTMQEIALKKFGKSAGVGASIAAFLYSTNTMEMMGIGFILHLVAGLPLWAGTIIGAVVVLVYTWTGGLWAVTMTDFIQFILMMVTIGLALIIGWRAIGGFDGVWAGLTEYVGGEDAVFFFKIGAGYLTPWTLVSYSLTAFAVLCEPAFFQRIFASAGPKEIKKAFSAGVPMWLSFDWAVTFLGIIAAAAVGLGIIPEVAPNEALFAIVGNYLPIGLTGLFVAGVLAAAMSTADSYFLVSGGVIGYDLYKGIIKPKAEDRSVERMTKVGMLISAALSIGLSFAFERIMGVWVFQATIIICTALIPVYFGSFSKKPVKKAAGTAATFTGLIGSVVYYILTLTVGYENEEIGTYVLKIGNVELWQEYGIIILVPIVLIVYLIVSAVSKKTVDMEEVKA